jgi:ADP-ribose pyrophosphatase YjhB (NUDIX family)
VDAAPTTTAVTRVVGRTGARLILRDPHGRVLLIHERVESGTPGGCGENCESLLRAAVRETFEETGIDVSLPSDAPVVHRRQRRWGWSDQDVIYDQVDHYFVAAVAPDVAVHPAALTALEQDTLLGFRWWTPAELDGTDELIEPPDLADILRRVLPDASAPA